MQLFSDIIGDEKAMVSARKLRIRDGGFVIEVIVELLRCQLGISNIEQEHGPEREYCFVTGCKIGRIAALRTTSGQSEEHWVHLELRTSSFSRCSTAEFCEVVGVSA